MKIEKFLAWVQEKLLIQPDIHLATVKLFIDKFDKCLSPREKEKFYIAIAIIKEVSNKQLTIKSTLRKAKAKEMKRELNDMRKGGSLK